MCIRTRVHVYVCILHVCTSVHLSVRRPRLWDHGWGGARVKTFSCRMAWQAMGPWHLPQLWMPHDAAIRVLLSVARLSLARCAIYAQATLRSSTAQNTSLSEYGIMGPICSFLRVQAQSPCMVQRAFLHGLCLGLYQSLALG